MYIDIAIKYIVEAIKNNKIIGIHFDTDLDGVSAGTIMYRNLSHHTNNLKWFINERKQHGLLGQDLDKFNDIDLLIIVDSLDKNVEAYKILKEKGKIIICLDHHDIDSEVPYDDYITLVSSQRNYKNPHLSGAGVVWKVCKYLDEYCGENYSDELADLAVCGLIGDMSDVSENSPENRYICKLGLEQIYNPAIKKIVGSFPFNSSAVSFSIAPLINASNRMNQNEIAVQAFLADENKEVLKYKKLLMKCRTDQNAEIDLIIDDIHKQGDSQLNNKIITIFIDTETDVAGLIGNKLLERYKRPIFILRKSIKNDIEYYSGSSRAIGIKDFRIMCIKTGLCEEANGHPLAFGIKVKKENYSEFIHELTQQLNHIEFSTEVDVDIELNLEDITRTLIDKIKIIDKISGAGFKPIVFKVGNVNEYEIGQMSDFKHLVIKPTDYFQFIKWNFNGDWEDINDKAMMGENLGFVGTLNSGFIGRNFSLQMICNDIIGV